jgi:hypothetical protein
VTRSDFTNYLKAFVHSKADFNSKCCVIVFIFGRDPIQEDANIAIEVDDNDDSRSISTRNSRTSKFSHYTSSGFTTPPIATNDRRIEGYITMVLNQG